MALSHANDRGLGRSGGESCRLRECETAVRALRALAQLQPRRAEVRYRFGLRVGRGCTPHSMVDPEAALSALRNPLDCPGTHPLIEHYKLAIQVKLLVNLVASALVVPERPAGS